MAKETVLLNCIGIIKRGQKIELLKVLIAFLRDLIIENVILSTN